MTAEFLNEQNNSVTLKVAGKIDANNAGELFEKLSSLREEHPRGTLNIDIADLEYISSAGLRSLLKIQKQEAEKIHLINASLETADIFRMTGLDRVMDVKRAYETISVEGLPVIGQGVDGKVYRVDEEKIVKVYNPATSIDYIENERTLAQKALAKGIPTAIAFNIVKVDDSFGVVFELLNAKSLSETIVTDYDNYDKYARGYTDLFKSFHTTEAEDGEFPSIKEIYYGYIDECKDWYTDAELNKLRELVDSIPDRNTLIHGDFHTRNIMVTDGELVMIDMGQFSMGHPIFDYLATAAATVNLVALNPDYGPMIIGMPAEYIIRLWNDMLKLYFSDRSDAEIKSIDKQIRTFSKLKVAMAPAVGKGASRELIQASVDDVKANLLPIIDTLIGTIDW